MNKFLIAIATVVALALGSSVAGASHSVTLTQGNLIGYSAASFCKNEGPATSIVKDLEENGMASSVKVYQKLIAEKECMRDTFGGSFVPLRLVYRFGTAIVVEVLNQGITVFFVSPEAFYSDNSRNAS